ncbi:hypothetical protein M0R45_012061 [Rubus argutus]|uniref:F-box domain-containing protein n=1 Tax=Rubus argutus TaxID=59490 RepID=A0AAW1YEN2_RUBAR
MPIAKRRKNERHSAVISCREHREEVPCRFQHLPGDLVLDILSRLSAKTVFNCRCVSKFWLFIISDPYFVRLHRSRSPVGILYQLRTRTNLNRNISRSLHFAQVDQCASRSDLLVEKMTFTPKNSLPDSVSVLINSCNGLVCLSGCGSKLDGSLYVCNPISSEYITIPPANNGKQPGAFVGLGFSVATNEYKLMDTFHPKPGSHYLEAMIYTIGTGVWRSIGNAPANNDVSPFNSLLHGALHWLPEGFDGSQCIQSFNFETEQFRPLPLPSEDRLKYYSKHDCLRSGVWESRCLLFYEEKFDMHDVYEPLMFLGDGEILMMYNDRVVDSYNQETKSFQKTKIIQIRSNFVEYSPCFVSLHDVLKGEEVKMIREDRTSDKLFGEGNADPGMPLHKNTKLISA